MKYEHVIWDWNGTLLDDTALSVDVFNRMARAYGLREIDRDYYRSNFRFPVADFYKDVGFDFDKHDFRTVGEFFISSYNSRRSECSIFSGARELMLALKGAGISQSVLSAYRRDFLADALEKFGIAEFLDSASGLDNIYAVSKEELGRQHIASLKIPPEKVLMVGDTEHDFRVAKAMGADCALMECGHNAAFRLRKLGAPTFPSFDELSDFILSRQ
ncbi:MAG: HAD family hydrolase [Verrucomicrobia bacterium]|nr:MAG: HAD family hydrolase [Verrucomicrobiota bacterium]